MQTIQALNLFQNCDFNVDELSFDSYDDIFIDFSNVKNIDLQDITTLLNIQKLAILNKKKIKIENVSPEIRQVLEITGLYKTFSNLMSNPILISKRLSL